MLAKYIFVGGSSFFVKAGSYGLLSRVLQVGVDNNLLNAEALFITIIYNYGLHRLWTFRGKEMAPGSVVRYLIVVGLSMGLDVALFYILNTLAGIYDVYVIVIIGVVNAAFGFFAHTFFSFHHDPFRRNGQKPKPSYAKEHADV